MKLLDRQLLTGSHLLKRGPLVCVRNKAGPLRHYLPLLVERLPQMDVVPFRCKSARGPDADRHVKLLIQFAVEGALSGAYSHSNRVAPLRCQFELQAVAVEKVEGCRVEIAEGGRGERAGEAGPVSRLT